MSIATVIKDFYSIHDDVLIRSPDTFLNGLLNAQQKSQLIACSTLLTEGKFEPEGPLLNSLIDRLENPDLCKVSDLTQIFKSCLKKCSTQQAHQILNLDEWKTAGDKAKACSLIVKNFLTQDTILDLNHLDVTSLPVCIFSSNFSFTSLNCNRNRIQSIPENVTRCTKFSWRLTLNDDFMTDPTFIFRFHPHTTIDFEKTDLPLTTPMQFFKMRHEFREQDFFRAKNAFAFIYYDKATFNINYAQYLENFYQALNLPLHEETNRFPYPGYNLTLFLMHISIIPDPFKMAVYRIVETTLQHSANDDEFRKSFFDPLWSRNLSAESHYLDILIIVLKMSLENDIRHVLKQMSDQDPRFILEADRLSKLKHFIYCLVSRSINTKIFKSFVFALLEIDFQLDEPLLSFIKSLKVQDKANGHEKLMLSELLEHYNDPNIHIDLIIFDENLFQIIIRTLDDPEQIQMMASLRLKIAPLIKSSSVSDHDTLQTNPDFNQLQAELRKTWLISSCEDD